ncbi:MAG: GGDEF domain-containing protein [Fibrobacter sp.]|nr:GGDEF domain-containing protein [Fibrobacter sp.]
MTNAPSFDLTTINVSNMLGVLLLCVLFVGNIWRFRDRSSDNFSLLLLMFFSLTNCLVDPLVYAVDGKPGNFYRFLIYAGNSWLFFAQISAAIAWVYFFCIHLNGSISRRQHVFLIGTHALSLILLIVNLFVPMVFDVSDANVYVRKPLFFGFAVANYVILLDSLVIYLRSRVRGGALKFFPVFVFAMPVMVGGVVQSLFYGISVTSVCLAISVAGILSSLQNEMIFRDSLTGLYNRSYLDYLLKMYSKKKDKSVTGIMLDLNGFKSINDTYGHAVGDLALVSAAKVLRGVVVDLGAVIRYAGDEFIVLVNSQDDRVIASCMSEIRRTFQEFNQNSSAPYKLTVSMGSCKMNFEKFSVDEFINEIDKRMYEDKKTYYAQNVDQDRRRR